MPSVQLNDTIDRSQDALKALMQAYSNYHATDDDLDNNFELMSLVYKELETSIQQLVSHATSAE